MIQAVLFDLDDTLLGNDVDTFLPAYFHILGQYAAPYLPPDQFIPLLLKSSRVTIQNEDLTKTNNTVFWETFSRLSGLDGRELEAEFERFYHDYYPDLESLTQRRPFARRLVQLCFAKGLSIVIATNPLFVRSAIEQRLAWADIPVTEFNYALVTTIENMHATKPNPAYYKEILHVINCLPPAVLMIGDSWENDIVPAQAAGLHTFWVQAQGPTTAPPVTAVPSGQGSLDDLYQLIESGWLERL